MKLSEKDRIDIIKVIDSFLDINNYVHQPKIVKNAYGGFSSYVSTKIGDLEWNETKKLIDEELRRRGLLKDKQNLHIRFDIEGNIKSIQIEKEIHHETPAVENFYDIKDFDEQFEITIKKKDSYGIDIKTECEFEFSPNEWRNFKRTELIDKALDGYTK